ncbi:hypothetical protein AB0H73_31535 [Streptomyces olivoreticuli]
MSTKFPENRTRSFTLEIGDQPDGFPFDASTGTSPAALSYFGNQTLGGVSDNAGWLSLPKQCGEDLASRRSGSFARAITIRIQDPSPTQENRRAHISKALSTAMFKLSKANGCATAQTDGDPALHAPSPVRPLNLTQACSLPHFSIPNESRPGDVPQQETEQVSRKDHQMWSCDIRFKEASEPDISITMTQDKNLMPSLSKGIDRSTPATVGWKASGSTSGPLLASCEKIDTYFSIGISNEYRQLIEKNKGISASEARKKIFQSFINSMGGQLGCPGITP